MITYIRCMTLEKDGYVMYIFVLTYSVNNYYPAVKNRLEQLIQLITSRMGADGVVDMSDCIKLWAYDVMVSASFRKESLM